MIFPMIVSISSLDFPKDTIRIDCHRLALGNFKRGASAYRQNIPGTQTAGSFAMRVCPERSSPESCPRSRRMSCTLIPLILHHIWPVGVCDVVHTALVFTRTPQQRLNFLRLEARATFQAAIEG